MFSVVFPFGLNDIRHELITVQETNHCSTPCGRFIRKCGEWNIGRYFANKIRKNQCALSLIDPFPNKLTTSLSSTTTTTTTGLWFFFTLYCILCSSAHCNINKTLKRRQKQEMCRSWCVTLVPNAQDALCLERHEAVRRCACTWARLTAARWAPTRVLMFQRALNN